MTYSLCSYFMGIRVPSDSHIKSLIFSLSRAVNSCSTTYRIDMKSCVLNCFRNDQELRCPADQIEVKDSQVRERFKLFIKPLLVF